MDQIEFLKGASLCKGFDESSIIKLAEQFEEVEFESGGTVFEAKSSADALYLIMEGSVNVYIKNVEGKEILIGKLIQQEMFGQLSLLGNFEHLTKTVAQENTTLLKLQRQRFIELNRSSPQLSLRVVLNIFTDFIKVIQENSDAFKYLVELYDLKREG
ncbi:MAG: cyclic nucleotide-binding domain-containing protein [Myxococcota bacterium]